MDSWLWCINNLYWHNRDFLNQLRAASLSVSVLNCCFPALWVSWTLFLINSQTLGQPRAMPPALHVKQRLTRLPALKFYSSTMLPVKSHCLDTGRNTHTHTRGVCLQTNTQKRSLKINAYMHKQDVQKHKLHTGTQRRVHTEGHTNTKHTSRLSLCFQLPDGPRGNQNFDTPGWKKESGEARQCQRHTRARGRARIQTQTQPRLSSRRQAKVYRECKNMTLRGGKKLCSSVRSHVFFFFPCSCLEGGERALEGLWTTVTWLLTFISWNDSLLLRRGFPSGLLWVVLYMYHRKVLLKWFLMTPSPQKCLY